MRLIFIIQCHDVTPSLVYNLDKISSSSFCVAYVHVDAKVDITPFYRYSSDNVFFIQDRIDVNWGHISQVYATLRLLNESSYAKADYISFVSGEDVIVGSLQEYHDFLVDRSDKEFVGVSSIDGKYVNPEERVKYRYPRIFYKRNYGLSDHLLKKFYRILFKIGFYKNKKIHNLPRLYKGSSWFTISGAAASYIMTYLEENSYYIKAFRNSLSADEIFFQTILMNSSFKKNIYLIDTHCDDNKMSLRYIDWESGPEYPKYLTVSDFNTILKSSCYFSRKISSRVSIEQLSSYFDSRG